jgi:Spy/CpxP family protein refolding chaperone
MRNKTLLSVLVSVGTSVVLMACGDSSATSAPPATPPPPPPETTVTASVTPPPAAPEPPPPAEWVDDTASTEGVRDHHRHHHGGVAQYILLSLDSLGLSPEKKAQIETIKAELTTRTAPAREAQKTFLFALSDGIAAGKVNKGKVDAALAQVARATIAAHDASADAFNQLHQVLSPEERSALVDKVQAHWGVWRSVNVDEEVGSRDKGGRLAHFAEEESLTPEQVEKIGTGLHAGKPDARWHVDPAEMEQFVKTFTSAFASDSFDAKTVTGGGAITGRLATAGNARLAHFFEVATPVLTPEQRTNAAQHLRERAELHHA